MILKILQEGHPKLRRICTSVQFPLSLETKKHARSLLDTVKSHKAYGVASNQTQCIWALRIIAVNIKEYKGIMINPQIIERSDNLHDSEEKCLSVKGKEVSVPRNTEITVSFQDLLGIVSTLKLKDLSAAVIQHEIEHLDGVLICDYI